LSAEDALFNKRAVATFAMGEGGGLLILADFVTLAHRELIVSLAAE
jgi:hypothetical protein